MGMTTGADGSLSPQAGYLTERIKELPEMQRAEMPLIEIKEFELVSIV